MLSIKPVKNLAYRAFAHRFVAGESIENALWETRELNKKGFTAIINYLGEQVKTAEEALQNTNMYAHLIKEISRECKNLNARISVKPSQLGLQINEDLYFKNLSYIGMLCSQYNIRMEIDMEEFDSIGKIVDNSIILKKHLPNLHLRQCLQIVVKRSSDDIKKLTDAGINIRLCKGAYKILSSLRLWPVDYTPFRMIVYANCVFPSFVEVATHDLEIINELKEGIGVQFLKGFFEKKREEIIRTNPVAVYVPFGPNWEPYGVRRLFYITKNFRKIFE